MRYPKNKWEGVGAMNHFDRMILEFLNRFSQRSWTFDYSIFLLSNAELFKGGVIVTVLWALWFVRDKEEVVAETHRTILSTFAGTAVALFLARGLAIALPFRERPLHQPAFNFLPPFGISVETLKGWSAFPSDHATLFIGLVTGIFLISRRLGFLSIVYVFLVVLIPRIYLGLHYPTDIIVGSILGIVCVLLANGSMMKKLVTGPLIKWSEKYPHLFYAMFFLVTYQTATLYKDIRWGGEFLLNVAKKVVHRNF